MSGINLKKSLELAEKAFAIQHVKLLSDDCRERQHELRTGLTIDRIIFLSLWESVGSAIEEETSRRADFIAYHDPERVKEMATAVLTVRPILLEHIAQCVNGGPKTCWICRQSDEWLDKWGTDE